MMKPKTGSSTSSHHQHLHVAMFMNETEFEVAEILLQLPQLVFESESLHRLSWGRKRRRSSKTDRPVPPLGTNFIPEIEKPKALSPATPLSFPPSECESDDKFKQSKRKVSFKRKKEELLEKIKNLAERKEFFKKEIKNLRRYYNEQKLLNLGLKVKKQMLILGLPKEDSASQTNLNHAAMLNILDEQQEPSSYLVHHPPLIMDDAAHTNSCEKRVVGSGAYLIDLNLLPEECGGGRIVAGNVSSVDKSGKKALAAEARQRRIQILRSKKHNVKIRYLRCE